MFLLAQNYVLGATLFAIDRARKKSLTSPRPVDAGIDRIAVIGAFKTNLKEAGMTSACTASCDGSAALTRRSFGQ
jgi:hypothetical protein